MCMIWLKRKFTLFNEEIHIPASVVWYLCIFVPVWSLDVCLVDNKNHNKKQSVDTCNKFWIWQQQSQALIPLGEVCNTSSTIIFIRGHISCNAIISKVMSKRFLSSFFWSFSICLDYLFYYKLLPFHPLSSQVVVLVRLAHPNHLIASCTSLSLIGVNSTSLWIFFFLILSPFFGLKRLGLLCWLLWLCFRYSLKVLCIFLCEGFAS